MRIDKHLSWLAAGLAGLLAGAAADFLMPVPYSPAVHLVISLALGVAFGLVVDRKAQSAGGALVQGLAFGLIGWLLIPLTLVPLLEGRPPGWTILDARAAFALLPVYLLPFGAVLGGGYYLLLSGLRWRGPAGQKLDSVRRATGFTPPRFQGLWIGGFAGLAGSWVFLRGIESADFFPFVASLIGSGSMMVGGSLHYTIGALIGIGFGLLFYRQIGGVGSSVIWGMTYGVLWWILGPLTLAGWIQGSGIQPDWSLRAAQAAFPALLAHMLYGAMVGFFYALANKVWRALFIDSDPLNRTREGLGAQGLRSILMGQAGGVIGGLLFTIVMVGIGALPQVAGLVGGDSSLVGFGVHLLIAITIGSSFGLLFQRQARSYAEALAWGLTYGLLWWLLGTNTLFNTLLRAPVDWSLPAVASSYPALVGHLLYGGGLGLFFHYLACRLDPAFRDRARKNRPAMESTGEAHQAGTPATPAPALWVVVLVIGVVLPMLLAPGG